MIDTIHNTRHRPMPLEGIKIVEYGVFHAGPGASSILGDLGADVVKIESGLCDPERYWTRLGQIDMSFPNGESFFSRYRIGTKRGSISILKKRKDVRFSIAWLKRQMFFSQTCAKAQKPNWALIMTACAR
jgi:hypothetical protein